MPQFSHADPLRDDADPLGEWGSMSDLSIVPEPKLGEVRTVSGIQFRWNGAAWELAADFPDPWKNAPYRQSPPPADDGQFT